MLKLYNTVGTQFSSELRASAAGPARTIRRRCPCPTFNSLYNIVLELIGIYIYIYNNDNYISWREAVPDVLCRVTELAPGAPHYTSYILYL